MRQRSRSAGLACLATVCLSITTAPALAQPEPPPAQPPDPQPDPASILVPPTPPTPSAPALAQPAPPPPQPDAFVEIPPYGWWRDDRGRLSQINFDLHRRLFVGGRWGAWSSSGNQPAGVDFGLLEIDFVREGDADDDTRVRLALIQGELSLAPFTARVKAARLDISARYSKPLLRIVTFIGPPRRLDGALNIGGWFQAGDLEIHETPSGREYLWRLVSAMVTVDLWQSDDLSSFVRLRGGGSVEHAAAGEDERMALTAASALDADLTLDENGKYHATALVEYEVPFYRLTDPLLGDRSERRRAEAAFEAVVLSINDQPVSIRASGGASWRDDIPGLPPRWIGYVNLGLRFSLWAPPRRSP